MAYTFDQINSVLGQQQAGANGNANIFGSGGSADTSQQGQSAQSSAGSGEAPKTTTEGELSAGSAGSSSAAGQPKQTSVQTSGQAILDKAKQANLDTGFTNKLVGDVKQGETTLQNEANAYTQAQGAKASQGTTAGAIEGALNGNKDNYGQVDSVLRGPAARADQFQSGVTNQFQDIDQIGSQGGLQSYLKKRGNENYTEGQAALDSLLFSRDKNFQSGLLAAKQERENLKGQKQNLESTLQGQAQNNLDAQQQAAKENTQRYIEGQKASFQQSTAAKIAAENARRLGVHNNINQYKDAQTIAAEKELVAQHPEYEQYIPQAQGNIQHNIVDNYHQADAGDVSSAQDAQRFNNIMGLLGQGGAGLAPAAQPYQDYTFDKGAYQNSLTNEINRLRNLPQPKKVGSSGVPMGQGGGIDVANPVNYAVDTAKEHPIETSVTGGLNVPVRAIGKKLGF